MKFTLNKIILNKNINIKQGMEILQKSSKKILCIVDNKKKLIGVVNDGDIRRSLLKQNNLEIKLSSIMNTKPITVNINTPPLEIKKLMIKKKIEVIPVLKNKKVNKITTLDEIILKETETVDVIINAGGLGTRLLPHTLKTHKTLLKINNKQILAFILDNFYKQGFKEFNMILNHKSEQIVKFIKKKKKSYKFNFVKEKKPLGTCGGVSMFEKNKLSNNFIFINCDVISGIDFNSLLSFHKNNGSDLTIVTSNKKIKLKYGSIKNIGFNMLSMKEKPEISFMVNAGIYVMKKNILDFIKKNKRFDIPQLINSLKKRKRKIKIYPTNEYWFDIGSKEDFIEFKKFHNDNKKIFKII